jgi:hypothetical protein
MCDSELEGLLLGRYTLYGETSPYVCKEIERIRNELQSAFPDGTIKVYTKSAITYKRDFGSSFRTHDENTVDHMFLWFEVDYSLNSVHTTIQTSTE